MRPLNGLDGSNPLGFLAALGVLNVLSDLAGRGSRAPTLAWTAGDWRALIDGDGVRTDDELVERIWADLQSWRGEACLDLKYEKIKGSGSPTTAKTQSLSWDLKPPGDLYRRYLERVLATTTKENRRSADFACAFATEMARDNNENTKPTALHFTAGQQEFLTMVGELLSSVEQVDVREALFGPWRYRRPLPVLGWDCTVARDYALRASDPSKDKKLGVPGADWLAFRGLSFIRVMPRGSQILTTGCAGGWKTGRFTWPLWSVPIGRDTVQALLQLPRAKRGGTSGHAGLPEADRRARGICAVFTSAIRRSDQGGYGSFAPSAAV